MPLYEHRSEPLLTRAEFAGRLARHFAVSAGLIAASLVIGVLGYRVTEHMAWVDSFLNAAMLMGGMGPVGELRTTAGKVFAGCYALYCGLVVIVAVGVLAAPLAHRIMHRLLKEPDAGDEKDDSKNDGAS